MFLRKLMGTKPSVAKYAKGGYQEIEIVVKDRYVPERVLVVKNRPVRLTFTRMEKSACSEIVLFPYFRKSLVLPSFESVSIELFPNQVGQFEFTCQMGMYKGVLIVKDGGEEDGREHPDHR